MKRPIILTEVEPDFKYKSIMEKVNANYVYSKYYVTILKLIKLLFVKKDTSYYYHIRYVKWRGYLKTIPIYVVKLVLCRLTNVKIVWTCHNIQEYGMPSKWQNKFLRKLIFAFSYKVIVMHKDLIGFLPKNKEKIIVGNFGEFKSFFASKATGKPNESFINEYKIWKEKHQITDPDIIFISTLPKIDPLISLAKINSKIKILIIAPKIESFDVPENVFLYTNKVFTEIHSLLENSNSIGYLGHDNISVPTSIYMYASYNIPILGFDCKPVSTLISENKLGHTFTSNSDILQSYNLIRANYENYKENCSKFINTYTWSRSSKIHSKIFSP